MRLLLPVFACLSHNLYADIEVDEARVTKDVGKNNLQTLSWLLYTKGPMRYNSYGRRGQDYRSYGPRGQHGRDYGPSAPRGRYDRDYLPGPRGQYDRDQYNGPRGQYDREYQSYRPRDMYDRDYHSYGPRGQYDRDYQSYGPSGQFERDYGPDRYESRERNYYSDRNTFDYYDESRRGRRSYNRGSIHRGANMGNMGGRTLLSHGSDYSQQYRSYGSRRPWGNRGDNYDANADLSNERERSVAYRSRSQN